MGGTIPCSASIWHGGGEDDLWTTGEQVTVKKLRRHGETLRLIPQNGEHEEIVVPAEEMRIQGEVMYVVHPRRRMNAVNDVWFIPFGGRDQDRKTPPGERTGR